MIPRLDLEKVMSGSKPKILFLDIETTPNKGYFWRLKVNGGYLSPENIDEEATIICASWLWYGSSKVESVCVDPASPKDDRQVTLKLHEVMSQADAWCAHNGDNFDIRWIMTQCLIHGLPPLPPCVQIDTKKMAKKVFNFNSNRLVYLAERLKVGKKLKTDFDLWKDCIRGDELALLKMLRYNRRDVALLPRVYKKLAPWVPARLNARLFQERPACENCGSRSLQSRGFTYTTQNKYRRFRCNDCGHWFRARKGEKK